MAEAGERFQDDSHVDESRLKLPENVTFDGTTQTGEEAEDVTYETRARYYRMRGGEVRCGLRGWLACVGLRDSHCYVAFQWKERGTGDVRFLRDRKSGVIRIVLRQDGTKHVRVNHNLHESLTLHQYQDSDKTLMYSVVGTPWLGRCPCLPDANLTSCCARSQISPTKSPSTRSSFASSATPMPRQSSAASSRPRVPRWPTSTVLTPLPALVLVPVPVLLVPVLVPVQAPEVLVLAPQVVPSPPCRRSLVTAWSVAST